MFEVCCRLCLEQVPLQNIHSLYGKHKETVIRDKIYELFQIQFSDTEKLSTVCNDCLEKIDTVEEIRDFFLEADKKFKRFLTGCASDDPANVNDKSPSDRFDSQNNDCPKQNTLSDLVEEHITKDATINDQDEAVKEEVLFGSNNHEHVAEIEMDPSDHESASEHVLLDICDNISESEISILGEEMSSNIAENPDGRTDVEDMTDHQDIVVYTSDQSCEAILNYDDSRMLDVASDEESDAKHLVEVDKSALISATDDDELSIVAYEIQCNVCDKVFENEHSFIQHSNILHCQEYPHRCKHCFLRFKTTDELTVHKCPKKGRIMACSECPELFQTVQDLRRHTKCIHGSSSESLRKNNTFKCDFCDSTMTNNQQLISHGQLVHPNEFVLHQCDHCKKMFGNKVALGIHKATHDRNFECSFCGKMCPTAVALAGHENTHTKEQPFQCSQCGRNFAQYTSMRRHMKIHFNEKAYQCDFCSKRFRQRTVMLTHRRIHTGEKPFTCRTCNKAFRDHSTLAKHKRVHERRENDKNTTLTNNE